MYGKNARKKVLVHRLSRKFAQKSYFYGMATTFDMDPLLLGLKLRRYRLQKGLSFQELSRLSGLSVSYLNEIEKGKKNPKPEKLLDLAKALGITTEKLMEPAREESMIVVERLLRSNFLRELPLQLFGIERHKVAEIIAHAPKRVSAFISTLLELARHYALREENFYFGALRAYLEMHDNYFSDLEKEVDAFRQMQSQTLHVFGESQQLIAQLQSILERDFGLCVIHDGLDAYPDLYKIRALFVPPKKQLLLQSRLNPTQRAFQLGKELGFQHLNLTQRAYTSSLLKVESFEHALSHFKAGYFSAALLMPREKMQKDIKRYLLKNPNLKPDSLLQWLKRYPATPEMFFQRLTNLLPQDFGLKNIFLIRVIYQPNSTKGRGIFLVDKELHLDHRHHPHANHLDEHYCRRWTSIRLINQLLQTKGKKKLAALNRIRFHGTQEEYLLLSMARPAYRSGGRLAAIELGIQLDALSRKKIQLPIEKIPLEIVNKTCERCPLENCNERVAPAHLAEERERQKKMFEIIEQILSAP